MGFHKKHKEEDDAEEEIWNKYDQGCLLYTGETYTFSLFSLIVL